MERNKLISLALSFTSFLVDKIEVKSVILFGSVAKNTFDSESDIDIFIETDMKNKDKINNYMGLYKKTPEFEKFRLEGIENEISIKIGKLDEWNDLKRSIISGGIVLFGAYHGTPGKLNHKLLIILDIKRLKRMEKIKIWRKIYGYKQKVGKKVYISKGFAERKVGKGAFLISADSSLEIIKFLNKNKLKYSYSDVWVE